MSWHQPGVKLQLEMHSRSIRDPEGSSSVFWGWKYSLDILPLPLHCSWIMNWYWRKKGSATWLCQVRYKWWWWSEWYISQHAAIYMPDLFWRQWQLRYFPTFTSKDTNEQDCNWRTLQVRIKILYSEMHEKVQYLSNYSAVSILNSPLCECSNTWVKF